jgi:hypothetical protein
MTRSARDKMDKTDMDRLSKAMRGVKDVLKGKVAAPGGVLCRFPHCSCNSPWEKCERKYST